MDGTKKARLTRKVLFESFAKKSSIKSLFDFN